MERKLNESWHMNHIKRVEPFYVHWLRSTIIYVFELAQVNPVSASGFGLSDRRCDLPLWSKLAELYFTYFSFKLAFCVFVHYEYDRLRLQLKSMNQPPLAYDQGKHQQRQQQLASELQQSIKLLDLVGSPWRELEFAVQGVYGILVVYADVIYFYAKYVFYKSGRVSLVRFILNPDKECHNIHRDTCQLADSFLVSSENYLRACRELKWDVFHRSNALDSGRGGQFISNSFKFDESKTRPILVQDVAELVLSGRLEPLNRTRRWLQIMELVTVSMMIYIMSLSLFLWFGIGVIMPHFIEPNFHYHLGPSDCWFFIELVSFIAIGLQVVSYYAPLLITISIDQTKYALELSKLIQRTIWDIDRTGSRFARLNPWQREASIRKLNMDIVTVIIQLKMFESQLASTEKIKSRASSGIIILLATAPLFARVLIAHLNGDMKIAAWCGSFVLMIITDSMIWPNCHLYAQCLGIQKGLSSLLAHLVTASHFGDGQLNISWLESGLIHSQWLLRKDLGMPHEMMEKFATSTIFGKLTHYNLLGVHFWCGVLLLSLWLKGPDPSGNPLIDALFFF